MSRLPEEVSEKSIDEWKSSDVSAWLVSIGMSKYIPDFLEADADGNSMCELKEEDLLKTYRVGKRAHRKKIMKRLSHVRARRKGAHFKNESGEKYGIENRDKENLVDSPSKKPRSFDTSGGLFVCGVRYEYGTGCTFCREGERKAAVYCLACGDFLCGDCDVNVHAHAKRSGHDRTRLSGYDASAATRVIVNFFRRIASRNMIRRLVRDVYERVYDGKTRTHLYRNRLTQITSRSKPICLGSEELKAFLTPTEAACKIQGVCRCWKARSVVRAKIAEQYIKVYDKNSGYFYYIYQGVPVPTGNDLSNHQVRSQLIPYYHSRTKPRNLHGKDLDLLFTRDLAMLRLQLLCRSINAKKITRDLIRKLYSFEIDPVSGKDSYKRMVDDRVCFKKPFLLGSEYWDPNDVRRWSIDDVVLYFRRMGFRKYGYVQPITMFSIDGPLLLTFEWQDFVNMGFSKSIHFKRVKLDLQSRFLYHETHVHRRSDLIRREELRRHFKMILKAIVIQKLFRKRYAQNMMELVRKVMQAKSQRKALESIRPGKIVWWSELIRHETPEIETLKEFGKRSSFDSCLGRGTYIGERWIPDETGHVM